MTKIKNTIFVMVLAVSLALTFSFSAFAEAENPEIAELEADRTLIITEYEKIAPCNELEIGRETLKTSIIAAKLVGQNPFVIWSQNELTQDEQKFAEETIRKLPGVGNPKEVLFLFGDEIQAYGMSISVPNELISFKKTSDWALVFLIGFEYEEILPEDATEQEEPSEPEKPEEDEAAEESEEPETPPKKDSTPAEEPEKGGAPKEPAEPEKPSEQEKPKEDEAAEKSEEPETPPKKDSTPAEKPEKDGAPKEPTEPEKPGEDEAAEKSEEPETPPKKESAAPLTTQKGGSKKEISDPLSEKQLEDSPEQTPQHILDEEPKTGLSDAYSFRIAVTAIASLFFVAASIKSFRKAQR